MQNYFSRMIDYKSKLDAFDFNSLLNISSLIFDSNNAIISVLETPNIFRHHYYNIEKNEELEKLITAIITEKSFKKSGYILHNSISISYVLVVNKTNDTIGCVSFLNQNSGFFETINTALLNQFISHLSDCIELKSLTKSAIESKLEMSTMLGAIYESTNEACTYINKDLKIVYSNKVAKSLCFQIFGREPKPNDNAIDFMLPQFQDEFSGYYQRVLNHERIEVEKTNGIGWWKFTIFPVYDYNNNMLGVAHNVKDITNQKLNEIEINRQNEVFKKIAWQQSHEVRRPVATILGLINLIESKKGNDTTKELSFLKQATTELDTIIHQIILNSI